MPYYKASIFFKLPCAWMRLLLTSKDGTLFSRSLVTRSAYHVLQKQYYIFTMFKTTYFLKSLLLCMLGERNEESGYPSDKELYACRLPGGFADQITFCA